MRNASAIIGSFLLLAPTSVWAGSSLQTGLGLFEDLEYEQAIPHFEEALADEGLESSDRSKAALHLAIIHVAYGDEEQAKTRFTDALRFDRTVSLPGAMSPHVEALFAEARAQVALTETDDPVEEERSLLRHKPPPPGTQRARIEITLDPARDVQVERLMVRQRRRGESIWFDITATRTGSDAFEAELPAPSADGAPVEYFVEALDRHGAQVGQLGSAATPLLHGPPGPTPADAGGTVREARPFYTQWWFIAGTGAVVTGAIIGGVIMATQSSSGNCEAPGGYGCLAVDFQ